MSTIDRAVVYVAAIVCVGLCWTTLETAQDVSDGVKNVKVELRTQATELNALVEQDYAGSVGPHGYRYCDEPKVGVTQPGPCEFRSEP